MPFLKAGAAVTQAVNSWQLGDHVSSLAWSPDDTHLAAATLAGPVTVLPAGRTDTPIAFRGHAMGSLALSWHPDGVRLATGGCDASVRLWSMSNHSMIAEKKAGKEWVGHLAWREDGRSLAVACGKNVLLFDPELAGTTGSFEHPSTVMDIAWRPRGGRLAAAAYGGVWLHESGDEEPIHLAWKGSCLALAWSPDGRMLAAGEQDAAVHFWFVDSGKDLRMWGFERKVRQLSWHASSRFLATGGGADATVWTCDGPNGPDGSVPVLLQASRTPCTSLAYQRKGDWLAAGHDDGVVRIWRLGWSPSPSAEIAVQGSVSRLAWSHHDRWLAVATSKGEVSLWEISPS